jgi:phage-related minor tail protein
VTHGFHHVLTSVLAGLACIGADAAMLVHGGVAAAFFGAASAGLGASSKLRLQWLRACASEAQQH